MATALTKFLEVGLLPIGDDDEKLNLLETSSADIAAKIEEDPALAGRIFLVALDPDASDVDPVHELAAATLAERWKTLANKVGVKPVQIQRGILLRAVELAAAKQPLLAGTLPSLCRRGARSSDTASPAISSVLRAFRELSASRLQADWVEKLSIAAPKLQTKSKKALSNDELAGAVFRAAGPVTDREGKPAANTNPHWPSANQPWASEFATRLTESLGLILASSQQGLRDELIESVRDLATQSQEIVRRAAICDAKAELLWLRMSEFSPSKLLSYRSMSPGELAIHAALDVSAVVPSVAPDSVFNFLRTLVGAFGADERPVDDVIGATRKAMEQAPELAEALQSSSLPQAGRRTWIECAVFGSKTHADWGESENARLSIADCAVQLFGELQMAKVLENL